MEKVIRAGIYIRVSTEEQAKHGYSIESQKSRLKAWAKEHNYIIVNVYADEGKSARTKLSNRKELLKLLKDVEEDKIDRIIIWRLDRWFRNVADYYRVQDILDKHKVDWECSDEEYNTTTSNGRLYLNIKLSIAQNESDQTSDRIRFNFDNMVKNKRPISGAMPVGYKIVGEGRDKRVVKDPDLEQFAIDMFDKYEETMSFRKVTEYLNLNYPQRPIGFERVKRHLKNTMYYGCYRDVEDYCEPYISKERWQKINDLIAKNKRKYTRTDYVFIFSGLIKCYKCGRRMSGSMVHSRRVRTEDVKTPTYKCAKHYYDTQCPNNHTITERLLEEWLKDNFLKQLNEYVVKIEDVQNEDESQDVSKVIHKLEIRKERLNELYLDNRISREKYETEYQTIVSDLEMYNEKATDDQKRDLSKYHKLLNNKNVLELYDKLNNENKKTFWYEYIDYIEQDDDKKYIIFFK